jgi:hypothetical protein
MALRSELPVGLDSKLRLLRRRFWCCRGVAGLLLTLAVLLAGMATAMLIDGVFLLAEERLRVMLSMGAWAVAVAACGWFLLRPLLRAVPISSVAREVERQAPWLEERWSTVAELAESRDPPEVQGARGLIRRVGHEADALAAGIESTDVVDWSRPRRWGLVVACLAAALVTFLFVAPTSTHVLLRRFWNPWNPLAQTQVESLTAQQVVAIGEPVELAARVQGRLRQQARLVLRDSGGNEERIVCRTEAQLPDRFTYALAAVQASFQYRWECGDGRTEWLNIRAEARPRLTEVRMRIVPPLYSGQPVQEHTILPRSVRALRGSRLELEMRPSKPLARMAMDFGAGRSVLLDAESEGSFRYAQVLRESELFTPQMVDEFGLAALDPPVCRMVVYSDQPPSVTIVSPEEEISVQPDDVVEVRFTATDDIGVMTAELLTMGGDEDEASAHVTPIPLEEKRGRTELQHAARLDLKELRPQSGDELRYAVRVSDGGNRVATSEIRQAMLGGATRPAGGAQADASSGRATTPSREATRSGRQPGSAASQPASESGTTQPALAEAGFGERPGHAAVQPASNQNARPQAQSRSGARQGRPGSQPASGGQSPAMASASQNQESCRPGEGSTSRPADSVTRRLIDVGSSTACSQTQRLQVDEWATPFAAQQRQKLQISIRAYLERLQKALAEAETLINGSLATLRDPQKAAGGDWSAPVGRAGEHLAEGSKAVDELKAVSADTPYAFMGLQLMDVDVAHVVPARRHLANAGHKQDAPPEALRDVETAALHVARARELLAALTGEFEEFTQREQSEQSLQHLSKMHQMFLEDMQALLGACKPTLNPRTGKMVEVPDDVAKEIMEKIKERAERRKALMDALAKILAKDPDLLRRYMDSSRKCARTLRDQLTVLAQRQAAVRTVVSAWAQPAQTKPADPGDWLRLALITAQMEVARMAAELQARTETWIPRGMDAQQGPLAQCRELTAEVALQARRLPSASASPDDSALDRGSRNLVKLIHSFKEALTAAGEIDEESLALSAYVAQRMIEADAIASLQEDMITKRAALAAGRIGPVLAVDQRRLEADTCAFAEKMQRVARSLGAVSTPEIGAQCADMADFILSDVNLRQGMAGRMLDTQEKGASVKAQEDLAIGFARAEKLFDELLDAYEDWASRQPTTLPPPERGQPLSLEEQLARLLEAIERESEACEKLGAVIRSNIMVSGDWAKPGDGAGSGLGNNGSGSAQASAQPGSGEPAPSPMPGEQPADQEPANAGQPTRSRQDEPQPMDTAMAEARAWSEDAEQALREARQARERKPAQASAAQRPAGDPSTGGFQDAGSGTLRGGSGRDFNVLASQLLDELRQGRENMPPEQYRQAIEDYFRRLSEAGRPVEAASAEEPR